MALSFDEFKQLRSQGVPFDQIQRIDKIDTIRQDPAYKGGANAPALVKARQDVVQNTSQNQNLDAPLSVAKGLQNMSWPVSLMYPKGAGQYQPTSSGGKAVADTMGIMNPLVNEGFSLAGKGIGKVASGVGNYIDKTGQVKKALGMLTKKFTEPQGLPKSELNRVIKEKGDDAVKTLRTQKYVLNKKILDVSDKTALDIQESLPKYFKDNSTTYGNELDKISDGLVKSKNEITRGEMSNIMQQTLDESKDELLASGKPMNEIEYLNKKYNLEPKPNESGLLDAQGKPMQEVPNPDEKLSFKEVVEDIKKVRQSLSSTARAGVKYTPEDVVAAKFMQKWGDYLETKVPALKELNQEYAPVIQTMKTAGKYFKPYSAGVDKLQGVSFLKQVATDKMQSSGKKLLDIMQNGTDRFPGIGTKTGDLESLSTSQKAVQKQIDDTIEEYAGYKKSAADALAIEKQLKDKRNMVLGGILGVLGLGGGAAGMAYRGARNLSKISQ